MTTHDPRPWVIGLTGGIGSGKTSAANLLGELGAGVIDTDVLAHQLTAANGAAMPAIAAEFGAQVVAGDGSLLRPAMREIVFADPSARTRLEGILHPMIREAVLRQTEQLAGRHPYIVWVIPLLVESSLKDPVYRAQMRRVCVVDCPEEVQIVRVMERSGLSREAVTAILQAQSSRANRLAHADDVIDNQGDRLALQAQVIKLHARYLALVTGASPA